MCNIVIQQFHASPSAHQEECLPYSPSPVLPIPPPTSPLVTTIGLFSMVLSLFLSLSLSFPLCLFCLLFVCFLIYTYERNHKVFDFLWLRKFTFFSHLSVLSFFSYFIALACTPSLMLNRSGTLSYIFSDAVIKVMLATYFLHTVFIFIHLKVLTNISYDFFFELLII